ncbi:hypothetical protein ACFWXK_13575 [Streptomyces sp. NPDC059070]
MLRTTLARATAVTALLTSVLGLSSALCPAPAHSTSATAPVAAPQTMGWS